MKHIKIFEDFNSDEKINSAIESALVEFSDDGFFTNCSITARKNTVSNIRVSNRTTNKYNFSTYKENFHFLYDLLNESGYGIYQIQINSSDIEMLSKHTTNDFEYIWSRVLEFSNDKFLSILLNIYKR